MLPRIFREREDLMDNFFKAFDFTDYLTRKDEQGNKIIELDVPGFNENNITINKDGYMLDVTGENDKGRKIEKRMTLPTDTDNIKANIQDGVLEIIFFEKDEQQGNKQIPINSE